MKKALLILLGLVFLAFCIGIFSINATADKGKFSDCTKITEGVLTYSSDHYLAGEPIKPGFDMYGYNYQAHLFNGYYCNVYDVILNMKWNDAWLSNKDCDGDGKLDRHFGFDSYIGSGAWETNHQFGTYTNEDGKECHWTYFVKIVAVPEDAIKVDGIWYTADGTEIGPETWGSFATIQEVSNDPCAGEHGPLYISPAGPGFGKWK